MKSSQGTRSEIRSVKIGSLHGTVLFSTRDKGLYTFIADYFNAGGLCGITAHMSETVIEIEVILQDMPGGDEDATFGNGDPYSRLCPLYSLEDGSTIEGFVRRGEKKLKLYVSSFSILLRMEVMRVIRYLLQLYLLGTGGIPFHAACFSRDDAAIGLIGPKRSGKTTCLLNVLSRFHGDLISNDKVIVTDSGSQILVYGLPVAAGIRLGTLSLFPRLCPEGLGRPEDRGNEGDRRYFSPDVLAKQFDATQRHHGTLKAFVSPTFVEDKRGFSWTRLTPAESRAILQDNLLRQILPEDRAWCHRLFSSYTNSPAAQQTLLRLSQSIPMFRLVYGEGVNEEISQALWQATDSPWLQERLAEQ